MSMSDLEKRSLLYKPSDTIFRSAYSTPVKVSVSFPAESPWTKQEFKDECDINIIMSRYQSTGEMPNINERMPQYADCTGQDYQAAMNMIAEANTLFNELPSAVRNRFANDPAAFLDFCSNPANKPEMETLGLLKPRNEWAPAPVPFGEPVADPPKAEAL